MPAIASASCVASNGHAYAATLHCANSNAKIATAITRTRTRRLIRTGFRHGPIQWEASYKNLIGRAYRIDVRTALLNRFNYGDRKVAADDLSLELHLVAHFDFVKHGRLLYWKRHCHRGHIQLLDLAVP